MVKRKFLKEAGFVFSSENKNSPYCPSTKIHPFSLNCWVSTIRPALAHRLRRLGFSSHQNLPTPLLFGPYYASVFGVRKQRPLQGGRVAPASKPGGVGSRRCSFLGSAAAGQERDPGTGWTHLTSARSSTSSLNPCPLLPPSPPRGSHSGAQSRGAEPGDRRSLRCPRSQPLRHTVGTGMPEVPAAHKSWERNDDSGARSNFPVLWVQSRFCE